MKGRLTVDGKEMGEVRDFRINLRVGYELPATQAYPLHIAGDFGREEYTVDEASRVREMNARIAERRRGRVGE